MDYDIFNGDADGICALLQLRKAEPREATLVTGVKRDIKLLEKIQPLQGDRLTVLDVSMDKNQSGLAVALAAGASVFYVDHHFPGEIPEHPALHSIINEAPDVCTAALVNGHLQGAYLDWAVTGAFGDNLKDTARALARDLDMSEADLQRLEQLGVCINYNGYGPAVDDLHFDPEDLYRRLLLADSALDFVHSSADFTRLSEGYASDMAMAEGLSPAYENGDVAVFQLPDEAWARRVSGVYSNDLATAHPARAHAVLTAKANGSFLVSVRAPLENKQGAAELCMQFPTGGGRAAAAGINDLPVAMLDDFVAAIAAAYKH